MVLSLLVNANSAHNHTASDTLRCCQGPMKQSGVRGASAQGGGRALAARRRKEPGEGVPSGPHPGLQEAAALRALGMGRTRTVCTRQWPQSLPPLSATNHGQAPGWCSRVTPASGAQCQLLKPCPVGFSGEERACTSPHTRALLPGGPPQRGFPTEGGERIVFLPFCSPDQDVAHPKFVNIVHTFSKGGRNHRDVPVGNP